MFELAQLTVGLWDSQKSVNLRKELDRFFVNTEAKDLCKDKIWSFFVFLALSSLICQTAHLFNISCGLTVLIKKGLIKKNYLGKSLAEQLFSFTLDMTP